MAVVTFYDRVKDTSTTTGTGTYTLSGTAPSSYQNFSVVGNSGQCPYVAVDRTTGAWEVGLGTYTSAGTTLSRDTILASSNANAAVSWSAGTRDLLLTLPAALITPTPTANRVPLAGTAGTIATGWLPILNGGGSLVSSNTTVPSGNTIANTNVETAFSSSYTIPANLLIAGDVLRVCLYGTYGTAIAPPNMTGKVKFGSTVMLNTGAITAVGSLTNVGWWAEASFIVQSVGASGQIEAQGYAEFATAATTGLSVNVDNTAPLTVDTTVSQSITVTITWSAASASNTITLREMIVERLTAQAAAGTVTQINTGYGLTGGPVTGVGTVAANPGVLGLWLY